MSRWKEGKRDTVGIIAAVLACALVTGMSGCGVGYGYGVHTVNAPPAKSDNGIPSVGDRRVTTTMGVHAIDLHDESGILSASVGTAANKYLAVEEKKRELRDTKEYREGKVVTGTAYYKRLAPVPGMRTKLSFLFGGSTAASVSKDGMTDELSGQELSMFGVRMQTALRTWVLSSLPALSIDLSQEAIAATYSAQTLQVPGVSPGEQKWRMSRFYWRFTLGTSYRLSPKLTASVGLSVDPIVGGLFALLGDEGGDGIGYGGVADLHYTATDWLGLYAHAQYDRGGTLAESTSSWGEVTFGLYYFWEPMFWKQSQRNKRRR